VGDESVCPGWTSLGSFVLSIVLAAIAKFATV
jgi:hypothetical protein